jgi:hypothetical protein
MSKWITGRLTIDQLLAFVFGALFVLVLLAIAIVFPNPQGLLPTAFRIILALAAAGVGAVIPGLLNIRIQTGNQLFIRAAGALALFVLVLFATQ